MTTKNVLFKALVPALLLAASSVQAADTHAPPQKCVFEQYAPQSVVPFAQDEDFAYGSYSFVRGAQLFVPATPGLTKEWLAASVQRALAAETGAADGCAPKLKDVQVYVVSAGNGFWVQLIGRDQRSADALLKWAEKVVARSQARVRHPAPTAQ